MNLFFLQAAKQGLTMTVVPRHFSQDIGEWQENQILIPDWPYLYCPGATQTHWTQVINCIVLVLGQSL